MVQSIASGDLMNEWRAHGCEMHELTQFGCQCVQRSMLALQGVGGKVVGSTSFKRVVCLSNRTLDFRIVKQYKNGDRVSPPLLWLAKMPPDGNQTRALLSTNTKQKSYVFAC